MKRTIWFLLAVLWLAAAVWPARAADNGIVVLHIDAIVAQGMRSYFARGIEEASARGAQAVIIELDTPGGDLESTLDIVRILRSADLPVIVYVSPPGATAASAGSVITLAGHVAAMAPGTAIGAASPVAGGGADLDETLYRKAVELMSAEVRSLTETRGADAVALAERMIVEATAVSPSEALAVGLIDIVADDLDDLLRQLDGREVSVRGRTVTLETADITVTRIDLDVLERLQLAIANPIIISTLLSVASLAIILELRAPGGYLAGIVGVICLVIALYGLGQLPANYLGLGLVLIAFILFLLETQTPTFGLLAALGAAALVGGFWVLFNTADGAEWARISLLGALGVALPTAGLFVVLGFAVARVQRRRPITGAQGMIGARGVATDAFKPWGNRYRGMVLVKGERWQAEAAEALQDEQPIVVAALHGFTLQVKPLEEQP